VVVLLPEPFHAPRSGPEVKNGRSSAEDGAPERLGCGQGRGESDPAGGVRKHCMKNSSPSKLNSRAVQCC